ncbi:MAG: alanine--tRNA ligase-related protein [Actinomycetota bacterium]
MTAQKWTIEQIQSTFLNFMADRGHAVIEGHSVRSPTDDVLFTTAGMHPLVPYLHGDEVHPAGKRLTDVQRCVRTTDIDEVGDNTHLTVFEMLGNWSLGDYFKETSIPQSFELLTGPFGIDPHRLYVTVFAGDAEVPADNDAPAIWSETFRAAGVDPTGRITPLGTDDNWWSDGRAGLCGPDTEIFVYVGDGDAPPFGDRPEFVEIWNNVFMTYNRHEDGTLDMLEQHNVDTGMGLERLAMYLNGHNSVWQNDELSTLLAEVADALGVDSTALDDDQLRSLRIVVDHLRAALVIAAVGIHPSASRQGYVLRKLVRRAVRQTELLRGSDEALAETIAAAGERVLAVISGRWHDLDPDQAGTAALAVVTREANKFSNTLRRGVEHLRRDAANGKAFDGDLAFTLADTLGYPAELSAEEAARIGMDIDTTWPRRYRELRADQQARSRR